MSGEAERQLLEMAAKAAGKDLSGWDWGGGRDGFYRPWPKDGPEYWNPLHDDGDEARLEAALMLHVEWHPALDEVCVGKYPNFAREIFSNHSGDKQKARRWAGVRAAAAIGRGMG